MIKGCFLNISFKKAYYFYPNAECINRVFKGKKLS